MKKILAILVAFSAVACGFTASAAEDRINVTDYGAIPNDGLDDTAAINSAINAGQSIYFPPGTYNYTGAMNALANTSYRFYGDGPGVSVIAFTGPGAGIHAASAGSSTLNVDGLTLEALSAATGSAIYAGFSNPNNKFHTLTVHNVEIRGNTEDGRTGGYWTFGINVSRAQNAVIDKVDITGNTTLTTAGIQWAGTTGVGTTGLMLSNIEIKFCNTAIQTSGWVEGLYLSNFEIVDNGVSGQPSLNLMSNQSLSPSPQFHLVNGHIDTLGDGLRMTNLSSIEISHVGFAHSVNNGSTADSTILATTNCINVNITDCTFGSTTTPAPANENGIFLTSTNNARISGVIFRIMKPTATGSCIVAYTGSTTVRVTDCIFDTVKQNVDNHIGTSFYYDADDNIVK
jgi:hypothetical protein